MQRQKDQKTKRQKDLKRERRSDRKGGGHGGVRVVGVDHQNF